MSHIPKISDTEWEVMRVIWAEHPMTASDVIDRLVAHDPTWHPKTVRTLLARLVQKGALGYEPSGRSYVYQPLVTEHESVKAASDSFLARVFGGSLQPMLAHFVERKRLTKADLEELQSLLNKTRTDNSSRERKHGKS